MNSEERKREREKENRRQDVKGRFEDSRLLIEKEFNMATRIRVKKKTPVKKVDIMPRYTWRELNSEGREHNESRRLIQKQEQTYKHTMRNIVYKRNAQGTLMLE